jgi:NAD(P)-dependent dehydrogenase (short-subunit alcohol dehydrogenase family)
MKKVWFITGSSRGLGRELTAAVLASGDFVAATARNISALDDLMEKFPEQLYPLTLDVNDKDAIYQAAADTVARFQRIDVLVNNAGFGITGSLEAFTEQQVENQLRTNLFAPIDITRAVLPYMHQQGSGRIFQISSIGGRIGTAGLTIYQAAKFGLSGFSEALAGEVAPLGIHVTCIEPGGFRTDWGGASMTYARKFAGYESTVDQIAAYFRSNKYIPVGDPEKAAKVLIDLAVHPDPPVHLVLGSEAAGLLRNSESAKMLEFEKWLPVTLSTDHDDAINFLDTEEGKRLLKH